MIPAIAPAISIFATFAYSSLGAAIAKAGLDDLRVIADELQDGVEGYYSDEYMVRNDSPIRTGRGFEGQDPRLERHRRRDGRAAAPEC